MQTIPNTVKQLKDFIDKRIVLIHRKHSEQGFSLIEMTVAMAILALLMPAVVNMMVVTVKARDVAMSTTENTSSYNAVNLALRKDVESASHVNVDDNNNVNISHSDGACVTWKIDNGELLTIDHNSKVDLDEQWVSLADDVTVGGSGTFFDMTGDSLIYDLKIGTTAGNTTLVNGTVSPKVMSTKSNDCW